MVFGRSANAVPTGCAVTLSTDARAGQYATEWEGSTNYGKHLLTFVARSEHPFALELDSSDVFHCTSFTHSNGFRFTPAAGQNTLERKVHALMVDIRSDSALTVSVSPFSLWFSLHEAGLTSQSETALRAHSELAAADLIDHDWERL